MGNHTIRRSARSVPATGGAGTLDVAATGSVGPSRQWGTLRRDSTYRRSLIAADVLAAGAALVLAVAVLGGDRLNPAAFLLLPVAVLASKVIGLYDRDELLLNTSTLDEAPALFQLATLYALGAAVIQAVLIDGRLSTGQIVALWLLLFVFALLVRAVARGAVSRIVPPERCLLVSAGSDDHAIGERLMSSGANAALVGRLELDVAGGDEEAVDLLEAAVGEHGIQRVILAPHAADSDTVLEAIRRMKRRGVKVSLCPRLLEVVGSSVVFDHLDGLPLLGVSRFGLARSSALVKRATDVVLALAVLILCAPLCALIAILIRLDSPGPVLFRQQRVGRDGTPFSMLKFRTMGSDAERLKPGLRAHNESEGLFKIAGDPRVTRVGRRLRATGLDELPQLLNVLRGDMSLVGPRPLVPDEDELVHGWYRDRLQLTPGMTGPWQLLGPTKVPLADMVRIDYLYAANWSLWTDVKLLLRTVGHVVRRGGM